MFHLLCKSSHCGVQMISNERVVTPNCNLAPGSALSSIIKLPKEFFRERKMAENRCQDIESLRLLRSHNYLSIIEENTNEHYIPKISKRARPSNSEEEYTPKLSRPDISNPLEPDKDQDSEIKANTSGEDEESVYTRDRRRLGRTSRSTESRVQALQRLQQEGLQEAARNMEIATKKRELLSLISAPEFIPKVSSKRTGQ
eukprot:TRINITY_DN13003_c0_g1_i2.p2 TRINITY_DN13003_c0_g1~~TRINITY_DN13003_c0_g1_i2.p2  ORF type:complete len:200 (-),score=32.76 TRINITY_DN13003_c0_g1_i2:31-630(-)